MNRIVDIILIAQDPVVSHVNLFVSMLKEIGFVPLKNDMNKLKYINKSSSIEQEQMNLSFIANGIHNYLLLIQNTQYLKNKRKNNATTHHQSTHSQTIQSQSLSMNQILNLLSREIVALLAPIIRHYRRYNCLDALKHELLILYYLQDDATLLSRISSINPTVKKAIIEPGLNEFVAIIAGIISFTIATKANMARNSNNNSNVNINLDCVSHVDYIVSHMSNNPRNIAREYCSQAMLLGYQGLLRQNILNNNDIQQLFKNQNEWFCYYCIKWNDKKYDICPSCQRGVNPLYFAMKNKSKHFPVDPSKFGIVKTFPTNSTQKKFQVRNPNTTQNNERKNKKSSN